MNKKGIYTLTYQLKNESGFVATFNETIEIKEAEFQYETTAGNVLKYKILGKYPYNTNNNVKFRNAFFEKRVYHRADPSRSTMKTFYFTTSSASPDAQGFTVLSASTSPPSGNFTLEFYNRNGHSQTVNVRF